METHDLLASFIARQLSKGRSRSDIKQELLALGWRGPVIDHHMSVALDLRLDENVEVRTPSKTPRSPVTEYALGGARKGTAPEQDPPDNGRGLQKTIETVQGRMGTVVACLGGALMLAGVLYLASSNWGRIPSVAQLAFVLALLGTLYGVAFFLMKGRGNRKAGIAMFLIGTVLFGGAIYVIGSAFGIRANWPDGLVLWMIGAVTLGMALESYPHYFLAAGLALASIGLEPLLISQRFFPGSNALVMLSCILMFVACAASLTAVVYIRSTMPQIQKDFYLSL